MPIAVNLNGAISPPEEARVSVFDRGFLYGDSIYETVRTYGGHCFMLDQHLARLERSAELIELALPLARAPLAEEVRRTVIAAANPESVVRISVTRGVGPIGLDISGCNSPTLVIIVRPLQELSPAQYRDGVAVVVARTARNSARALNPEIKSGNFLNNILGMREATEQGAFEALMLNQAGYLAEATQSNVFMVRAGELATPAPTAGILRGITRELLIRLSSHGGLPVVERDIFVSELFAADELF